MRDVKFRAKDCITRKWVYGYLFKGKSDKGRDYAFILQDKGLKEGGAAPGNAIEFPFDEASLVDAETIGQYTGFKDKNGVEIYEGDIVRLDNGQYDKISWDTLSYQLLLALADEPDGLTNLLIGEVFDGIEVIGNIYDNKELLGNKE